MDRRDFLQFGSSLAVSWLGALNWPGVRLCSAEEAAAPANPDWTEKIFNPTAAASSYQSVPPWGYGPTNVFGDDMLTGWQSNQQMVGAWLEIRFPEARPVQELWLLGRPWPQHIIGDFPFFLTAYDRSSFYAPARKIRVSLSDSATEAAELHDTEAFQIIRLPAQHNTSYLRIVIDDIWRRPGVSETGIAKVRAFARPHEADFEITAHPMYDVRDGRSVQTATLRLINPGSEVPGARLVISQNNKTLMEIPLAPIPGRAVSLQPIWISAPFADAVMEFEIKRGSLPFGSRKSLQVPAYRSFFDQGIFAFNCTCHNDLGWLDTQEKTADYRSSAMILPALKLLKEYPEYRYSMESTAYLMEFLDRHPERREEITTYMQEGRFAWGASYVQCLETHVGPEKLVRQFYLGRRWLRENFPGVDTRTYYKTDPPSLTLQMPQILAKAGIKYLIQGRMPFGYYNWQAPDGSRVFTYALPLLGLVDPKGNEGWLYYGAAREAYYAPRNLPDQLMFDYWMDYLHPQADLPPYVRDQNAAMTRFGEKWNEHYAAQHQQQIHPPRMTFTHAEEFLDEFTKTPLDIATLCGDWPANWAYYDEPGNRTALLAGRLAHNRLLTAERIYAGLSLTAGFQDYPAQTFAQAWQANLWPDHGWGGNKGLITDDVYLKSYQKSQQLADGLLEGAGAKLACAFRKPSDVGRSLVVFNPLTWERTDMVHASVQMPAGWDAFALRNDAGENVPYELLPGGESGAKEFVFVAKTIPSLGCRRYYLEPASPPPPFSSVTGDTVENDFFKATFGAGGIKTLYDKRLEWDVLRTDKLDGGEVIQFTAPGYGWDDEEIITLNDFDKTSKHEFPMKAFTRTPVRTTAVREAAFEHFRLRQKFHLYRELDRLDIELELLDWDGPKERELRVAFPINLAEARCTYEVPFGKVEMGKDEMDFSLLPSDPYKDFGRDAYGGKQPLPFREALNWIDVSDTHYLGHGCLSASDCTVHFFRDQTANPAEYPVMQHVLLSTRQSHAWNPEYWCTQKGSHRFRMCLIPHAGDWRLRYREGIGFNYPLVAFMRPENPPPTKASTPPNGSFFQLAPGNLVLSALKKSEDGNRLVLRFYEAEGFECEARVSFAKPVKQAWMTNLIEDEERDLPPGGDGLVRFPVRPWEIVTLKIAF